MIKLRNCSLKLNQLIQQRCRFELVTLRPISRDLPVQIPKFMETALALQKNNLQWSGESILRRREALVQLADQKADQNSESPETEKNDEKLSGGKDEKNKNEKEKDEKDKKDDEDDDSDDDGSKGSLLIPLWNLLKMWIVLK